MTLDYRQFLESKICIDRGHGFEVEPADVNPILLPHQRDIVRWAVAGGWSSVPFVGLGGALGVTAGMYAHRRISRCRA